MKELKQRGPEAPTNSKKKKDYTNHLSTSRIKVAEAASIKMMFLSGAKKSDIAKTFSRSPAAVSSVLDNFDKYLPDNPDLKAQIEAQIEQVTNEILSRSKAIVDKADAITYDRLDSPEVSPLEATKISEVHLNRFAQIIGENRLKSIDKSNTTNNVQINIIQEGDKNNNQEDGDKFQPEQEAVYSVETPDQQDD